MFGYRAKKTEYRHPAKEIEVLGVRICYVEKGPLIPLGPRKTMIFIHGLGGSLDNWDHNIPHFSGVYRTIALDLPGFGQSEKPIRSYSIKFFARTIREFMHQKGIRRAVLVGNSMGGHVCLTFALKFPQMVEKLVLVDPLGAWKEPGILTTTFLALFGSAWWISRPRPRQIRWVIGRIFYDTGNGTARRFEKKFIALAQSREFPLHARAIYHTWVNVLHSSLRHRLSEVKVPTLIVWGREDRLVTPKLAPFMHRRIRGSQLIVYDRCGHVPMMEKPRKFNRDVESFLRE